MRNSTASEFSRPGRSPFSFRSLTANELKISLLSFYLALDFDGRRARFGAAVSDDSLRQHCRQLDPDRTIVIACWGPSGLVAAIELHPLSSGWEDSELVLADRATADRTKIIAHLLQLAAFAAGERGCTTLILPCCSPERVLVELLRGMGRVRVQGDTIRAELGEYASLYGRHDKAL
jgi:hypothetical protein